MNILIEAIRNSGHRPATATTTVANVEALRKESLDGSSGEWFDLVCAGDIVTNKKPVPEIYFQALTELALSAGRCVASEDSCNGMPAADAVGIQTIVIRSIFCRAIVSMKRPS